MLIPQTRKKRPAKNEELHGGKRPLLEKLETLFTVG